MHVLSCRFGPRPCTLFMCCVVDLVLVEVHCLLICCVVDLALDLVHCIYQCMHCIVELAQDLVHCMYMCCVVDLTVGLICCIYMFCVVDLAPGRVPPDPSGKNGPEQKSEELLCGGGTNSVLPSSHDTRNRGQPGQNVTGIFLYVSIICC